MATPPLNCVVFQERRARLVPHRARFVSPRMHPSGVQTMTQSRKYILHSRHEWQGESPFHWAKASHALRSNSFLVADIGNCLELKLGGFIEEQQAVIQDVAENQITLQMGGSPWRSFLMGGECPIDMEIHFARAQSDRNRQSKVEVTIHDRRWRGGTSHFETAARRVFVQLQHHLMAVHVSLESNLASS